MRCPSRALRALVPPLPRIAAGGGTSHRVRIPLRCFGVFGVSRPDTGLRGEVKPVTARRPCCPSRTRPRRSRRSGALPEMLTREPCARFAKTGTTLVGFVASIARVVNVSQVPVTFRPHHLRGFLSTPLAATLLTVLPGVAGALLRFSLQRFSPPPTSRPFPGSGPHAVGTA